MQNVCDTHYHEYVPFVVLTLAISSLLFAYYRTVNIYGGSHQWSRNYLPCRVPYFVPGINQFHFCICFHVCVQCCDVCYDFLVKQYSALLSYSSSHWKLTCSRHDIPENLLNWRYATITHSLKIC